MPANHGEDVDPPQKDSISTSRMTYATSVPIASTPAMPVTSSTTELPHGAGINTAHLYSFLQYYTFYKDKLRARNSCSADTSKNVRIIAYRLYFTYAFYAWA